MQNVFVRIKCELKLCQPFTVQLQLSANFELMHEHDIPLALFWSHTHTIHTTRVAKLVVPLLLLLVVRRYFEKQL